MTINRVTFRYLLNSDYALLSVWLRQPHIARWWADDPSLAGIKSMYDGCVYGTEPAEVFIALLGDQPVGLFQRFRIIDYTETLEEMAPFVAINEFDFSIDYLIGDMKTTGRGLGTQLIRAFVERLWKDAPEAQRIVVAVHEDNLASWRVLEKNGFARYSEADMSPDNPDHSRRHLIYTKARPVLRAAT